MIVQEKTTAEVLEETRRILSETSAPKTTPAASACCSTEKQETCCEPSEKSSCCGSEITSGGGCGCQ